MSYREEKDTMGTVRIPGDAYYGAQTQRAVDNFPISNQTFPPVFIRALALIKECAAAVNADKAEPRVRLQAGGQGLHRSGLRQAGGSLQQQVAVRQQGGEQAQDQGFLPQDLGCHMLPQAPEGLLQLVLIPRWMGGCFQGTHWNQAPLRRCGYSINPSWMGFHLPKDKPRRWMFPNLEYPRQQPWRGMDPFQRPR